MLLYTHTQAQGKVGYLLNVIHYSHYYQLKIIGLLSVVFGLLSP